MFCSRTPFAQKSLFSCIKTPAAELHCFCPAGIPVNLNVWPMARINFKFADGFDDSYKQRQQQQEDDLLAFQYYVSFISGEARSVYDLHPLYLAQYGHRMPWEVWPEKFGHRKPKTNTSLTNEQEADKLASQVVNGETVDPIVANKNNASAEQKTPPGTDSYRFENKVQNQKSSGENLPDQLREEMETKLGADFSGVKIHNTTNDHALAAEAGAQALTHGQDILFGKGKYDPDSTKGKELLAHELVHAGGDLKVVQRKDFDLTPSWVKKANTVNKKRLAAFIGPQWEELCDRLLWTSNDEAHHKAAREKGIGDDFAYLVAAAQKILFPESGASSQEMGYGNYDGILGEMTYRFLLDFVYNRKKLQNVPSFLYDTPVPEVFSEQFIKGVANNIFFHEQSNWSTGARRVYSKMRGTDLWQQVAFANDWDMRFAMAVYDAQIKMWGIGNVDNPGELDDETLLAIAAPEQDKNTQNIPLLPELPVIGNDYMASVSDYNKRQSEMQINREKLGQQIAIEARTEAIRKEGVRNELNTLVKKNILEVMMYHIRRDEYNDLQMVRDHSSDVTDKSKFDQAETLIRSNQWILMEYQEKEIHDDVVNYLNSQPGNHEANYFMYEDYVEQVQENREKRALAFIERTQNHINYKLEEDKKNLLSRLRKEQQAKLDAYINQELPGVRAELRNADRVEGDEEMNRFIHYFVDLQKPTDTLTPKQKVIMDAFIARVQDYSDELDRVYNDIYATESAVLFTKAQLEFEETKNNYVNSKYSEPYYIPKHLLEDALADVKNAGFRDKDVDGKEKRIQDNWEKIKPQLNWAGNVFNNIYADVEGYRKFTSYHKNKTETMNLARAEYYEYVMSRLYFPVDKTGKSYGVSTFMLRSWANSYKDYLQMKVDYWQKAASPKSVFEGWQQCWGYISYDRINAMGMLEIYNSALDNVEKMLDLPDEESGFWENFASGFTSVRGDEMIPFIGSLVGISRNYQLKNIAEKAKTGSLSEEEFVLIETYAAFQQLKNMTPDSVGYMVGSGVAQAIPFLIEFVLTVGAFSAGKTAVTAGVARVLGNEMAASVTGKIIAKTAGYLAGAFTQTLVNPQQVFKNATSEMLPQSYTIAGDGTMSFRLKESEIGFGEAIAKGFLTTASSFLTESLGEVLVSLPRNMAVSFMIKNPQFKNALFFRWLLGKKVVTMDELLHMKATSSYAALTANSTLMESFRQTFGISGAFTEYVEEALDNRFADLIHGENPLHFEWKDEFATFLTGAFISGPFQLVSVTNQLTSKTTIIQSVNAETGLTEHFEFDRKLLNEVNGLANRSDGTFDIDALRKIISDWNETHPENKIENDKQQVLEMYYGQGAQEAGVARWASELTSKDGNIEGYKALISLYLGRTPDAQTIVSLTKMGGAYASIAASLSAMQQAGVPPLSMGSIAGYIGQAGLSETERTTLADFFKNLSEQHGKNLTSQNVTDEYFVFITREGLSADAQAQFDSFRIAGENTAAFRNRIETVTAKGSLSDYLENREKLNAVETSRPDAGTATSVGEFTTQSTTYQNSINASPLLQGTGAGSMAAMSLRGDLQALIVAQLLAGYDGQGRAGLSGKKEKVQERFDKRSDRFFEILSDPDMSIADKKKLLTRKAKQMQRFMNRHDVTAIDFKSIFAQIDAISESNFGSRYLYNPETGMVQVDGKEVTLDALKAQLEAVNNEYMFHNIARSYRIEIRQHGKGKHTRSEVIIHADKQAVPAPLSEEAQLRRAMPGVTTIEENNTQKGYAGMLDNRMYVFMNRALGANARTLLEEFSHIWLQVCDVADPKLIDGVIAEVKKSKAYQQLASDPNYKKAAESSSDATRYLVKELLAKAASGEQLDFSAVESNTPETNPSWLKTFLDNLWEALKNALRKLGLPVKAETPATITAAEFAQQIRAELTQNDVVFNATSQQLLDFIEGRSSKLDIQNSMLAGKDAKGSIVAENWYSNPLSPEAKQELIQHCKAILQQRNIVNSSSFDPVFEQYPEESLFFMKRMYFANGKALQYHIERRSMNVTDSEQIFNSIVPFPDWEPTWGTKPIGETDLFDKKKRVADYEVEQRNWNTGKTNTGVFTQEYNVKDRVLTLTDAFLQSPNYKTEPVDKNIEHAGTTLDKENGTTPTFAYITIMQMKDMGINYGSLRRYEIAEVVNFRTLCQLAKISEMNNGNLSKSNEAYRELDIVQPADTQLQISGHQINNVEIDFSNSSKISFKNLIEVMGKYYSLSKADCESIMQENGLDPGKQDELFVNWKFKLVINLAKTKYNETN